MLASVLFHGAQRAANLVRLNLANCCAIRLLHSSQLARKNENTRAITPHLNEI